MSNEIYYISVITGTQRKRQRLAPATVHPESQFTRGVGGRVKIKTEVNNKPVSFIISDDALQRIGHALGSSAIESARNDAVTAMVRGEKSYEESGEQDDHDGALHAQGMAEGLTLAMQLMENFGYRQDIKRLDTFEVIKELEKAERERQDAKARMMRRVREGIANTKKSGE